jgi:hypothetical protein
MNKASSAAIGAAIVTLCATVALGAAYALYESYVPYTEIVYCNGEEIVRVTAKSRLNAAHPHIDGDWVVWYEGKARSQVRVSHCQSIIIRPVPVAK